MLIHDDIKFFDNVVAVYLAAMEADDQLAIVGDLGGSKRCPFGPCGGNCSPLKILEGQYPCQAWPITGRLSMIHTILGRYKRNCRINEWCCMLRVDVARKLTDQYGICFGNYEGGGDVGTYWFEKIIKLGYHFPILFRQPKCEKIIICTGGRDMRGIRCGWTTMVTARQSTRKNLLSIVLRMNFNLKCIVIDQCEMVCIAD